MLGTIAVQGVGFEAQFPGHAVTFGNFLHVGFVGQIDGFGNGTGKEGLGCRHHADMTMGVDKALANFAALVGAVEHGVVLGLKPGSPFNGHGATDVVVGSVNLLPAVAQRAQEVETGVVVLLGAEAKALEGRLAEGPDVEDKTDLESRRQNPFDLLNFVGRQAFVRQGFGVDVGGAVKRCPAFGVINDVANLVFRVIEVAQGHRDGLVDDFEVASSGEFLEFDQRKIRLNAGGVAIHNQTNGARRGQNRGLCVAIPVGFAEAQGIIPGVAGCFEQVVRAMLGIDAHRADAELFVLRSVVSRVAVVPHDALHVLCVLGIPGEGAENGGHFR